MSSDSKTAWRRDAYTSAAKLTIITATSDAALDRDNLPVMTNNAVIPDAPRVMLIGICKAALARNRVAIACRRTTDSRRLTWRAVASA